MGLISNVDTLYASILVENYVTVAGDLLELLQQKLEHRFFNRSRAPEFVELGELNSRCETGLTPGLMALNVMTSLYILPTGTTKQTILYTLNSPKNIYGRKELNGPGGSFCPSWPVADLDTCSQK